MEHYGEEHVDSHFDDMMIDMGHDENLGLQHHDQNETEPQPHANPRDLLINPQELDVDSGWKDNTDSEKLELFALPEAAGEGADVPMKGADFDLSKDAIQYLHCYVECKRVLDEREKAFEQQLKDLHRAHNELGNKKIEVKRLQKELDRVKEDIDKLNKLVANKDQDIAALQASLKDARDRLAVEQDLQQTRDVDQHARNLQALLDSTIKGRDELLEKMRNENAQREQEQTNLFGQLTLQHCKATAALQEEKKQLKAEYEAETERLEDEKQACIDRHDEAVGKIQVEMEFLEAERDTAIEKHRKAEHDCETAWQDRGMVVEELKEVTEARDKAQTERDVVVSQCQTLAQERDNIMRERDEFAQQRDRAQDMVNRIIKIHGGQHKESTEGAPNEEQVPDISSTPDARFETAPKVEDDIVLSKWKDLYAEVTFLAAELNRCPDVQELNPNVVDLLCAIMPADSTVGWIEYMVNDNHRKWLVEALVWEIVCRFIESNQVWQGNRGYNLKTHLENVRNGLMPTKDISVLKQYSITRAEQAQVLEKLPGAGHDLKSFQITLTLIKQQLYPFYPLSATKLHDQALVDTLNRSIDTLFYKAHELDCIFMLSLAHWKLVMRRQNNYWNASFHEVPEWTGDVDVKNLKGGPFPICFQVAPCLRKSGTSEGKDYDKSIALKKGTIMPYVHI